MPELVAPLTCHHHPDRPAIAICVACGKRICPACATPWEGRQYCATCLVVQGRAAGRDHAVWGWAGMVLAGLVLFLAVTALRPLLASLLAELQ